MDAPRPRGAVAGFSRREGREEVMVTPESRLMASALRRNRLTRTRRSRRAQLACVGVYHWRAGTNYGIEVVGYTAPRAAASLDAARGAVNRVIEGEPTVERLV